MNTPKTQPKTASTQPKYHDRITPEGHADEIPAPTTPAHTLDECRDMGCGCREPAPATSESRRGDPAHTPSETFAEIAYKLGYDRDNMVEAGENLLRKLNQACDTLDAYASERDDLLRQHYELEKAHKDEREQKQRWFTAYKKASAAHDAVAQQRDEAKLELAGTKANLALTEAQRDDWQEKHASALVELMARTSERDEALAKLAQRDKDYSGCLEIREQYKRQRDEANEQLATVRELRELDKKAWTEREQELLRVGKRYLDEIVKLQAQRDELQAKLSDAVPADIHLKITGQLKQDLAKAEAQLNQAGERGAQVSTKADADPECSLCTWEGRRCARHRAMDNHERIRRAVGFIGMSREALIARINKLEEKGTQS